LMEGLWQHGAKVQAYDPVANNETLKIYPTGDKFSLFETKEAALKDADALILVTEWPAFRAPDFELIKKELKNPIIFDGRNLYDPKRARAKGFEHISIGRPSSASHIRENQSAL